MTIYTAIFNNVDELKEPFVVTPGWKYVCFSDHVIESDVWEVKKVPVMAVGPAKTARYYKIMFHKFIQDQFSIWIDGTFFINTDLDKWWSEHFMSPFTTMKHPFDDCVYKEARSCIDAGKGDPKVIYQQTDLYSHLGIKKHSGLIASGILMRENTIEVKRMCQTWWSQVEAYSTRDQIAFAYAQHKHKGIHNVIDWNYTTETEFIHCPHLTKAWRSARYREIIETYGPKSK